jgi:hypothetical protein
MIMVKLSKTSKMPCLSWSLPALDTCPASIGSNKELVDACKGCYATTGFYTFGSAKMLREFNKQDWKRDDWVDDMVSALSNSRYFRWFDSGDIYQLRLAKKILEVVQQTPWVKHWLPTRMYKFDKFKEVLNELGRLDNCVVRFSSDSISGGHVSGHNTSTIIASANVKDRGYVCNAYERAGKCGDCRACWDKNEAVIAYPMHGRKGLKLIKMQEVA